MAGLGGLGKEWGGRSGLTDECDGLRKELGQVLAPVVRDGDLLVVKVAILLEEVGEVGGDIEDVADAQLGQALHVGAKMSAGAVPHRSQISLLTRLKFQSSLWPSLGQ